ncbi:MAG: hypothetical protein US98_C0008G0009 [Parcubacteria group bacterium GW2011_GWC1_38_6]|nr:MAG: hypothetical protein US98_C0008G0009 [Parcubacteria group bacterium GW2011_GWC1_38_6]
MENEDGEYNVVFEDENCCWYSSWPSREAFEKDRAMANKVVEEGVSKDRAREICERKNAVIGLKTISKSIGLG